MMRTRQRLLPKILAEPEFDLDIALYHGEFVASLASIEHRGVELKGAGATTLAKRFASERVAMASFCCAASRPAPQRLF